MGILKTIKAFRAAQKTTDAGSPVSLLTTYFGCRSDLYKKLRCGNHG